MWEPRIKTIALKILLNIFQIDGDVIEVEKVSKFCYLRSEITNDGEADVDAP